MLYFCFSSNIVRNYRSYYFPNISVKDAQGFLRDKTAMMTTLVAKSGACKDADDYNEDNDDVNEYDNYDNDDEKDNNKNHIMPFLDDEDNNRSYYTITCFQNIFLLILIVVFMG